MEGEGNHKSAEQHYVEAADWKSAVHMYRSVQGVQYTTLQYCKWFDSKLALQYLTVKYWKSGVHMYRSVYIVQYTTVQLEVHYITKFGFLKDSFHLQHSTV